MVKPHRAIFEPPRCRRPAVLLDTPYGFQENADDISDKAVAYFADSVGPGASRWRRCAAPTATPSRGRRRWPGCRRRVWAFAGPGSPTYALRQWKGTDLPDLLADKLAHGGAVVFASAAALTLGRYTIPVYEIYKAGEAPAWAEGLDLLGGPVAVIPHYDNAEGGHHDTRFCYLGERRLRLLEAQMPRRRLGARHRRAHRAARRPRRRHRDGGRQRHGDPAQPRPLAGPRQRHDRGLVGDAGDGRRLGGVGTSGAGGARPAGGARRRRRRAAPRSHAAIRAPKRTSTAAWPPATPTARCGRPWSSTTLLAAWAGDTAQSDASDRGRAALRRMVVRLGELARDRRPRPRRGGRPVRRALLAQRAAARGEQPLCRRRPHPRRPGRRRRRGPRHARGHEWSPRRRAGGAGPR